MLKLISKIDCPRCVNVKAYLYERGIDYQEEMAEVLGYEHWREFIQLRTEKLGFPLLIYNKAGMLAEYANGSFEEIIEAINRWFPIPEKQAQTDPNKDIVYSWGE